MKNKIEEIKKDYWEEVNKINREVPKHTSRIHKFGYKYKLGHIFITVTDFGNIWSFIQKSIKEVFKDGVLQGHFEASQDKKWYINQAVKEEDRRIIKIIDKEIKGWERDGKEYKGYANMRFTDGAIASLELLKDTDLEGAK